MDNSSSSIRLFHITVWQTAYIIQVQLNMQNNNNNKHHTIKNKNRIKYSIMKYYI